MTWFWCHWDWLLGVGGNLAAIITAVVAGWAGSRFLWQRHLRKESLQAHLVNERMDAESPGGEGVGSRSIMHLMGNCSMTEAQVLEAAFGNKNIKTWIAEDPETGRADTLFFRIDDKAWKKLKPKNPK
jgi:hypothetical protein